MPIVAKPEPTDLERAFARYRATQSAIRGRGKPSLADIDAALEARVELFERLVETGWQPPEPVARQIDLDAALVVQPHGSLGG
jgi:hypothetical protein